MLKRAAAGIVAPSILARKKQPYRAPDALAFVGDQAPGWIQDLMSREAIARVGLFDPELVSSLWAKCLARAASPQFSNADNMAVVGILSSQLLHQQFVAKAPRPAREVALRTCVDRTLPQK